MATAQKPFPREFIASARKIALEFPLPREFVLRGKREEGESILRTLLSTPADKLEQKVLRLSGRQLQELVLCLPDAGEEESELIRKVTEIRGSGRLLQLLWVLFQYHEESAPVVLVLQQAFAEIREERALLRLQPAVLSKETKDRVKLLCDQIAQDGGAIEEFAKKSLLIPDSPFGQRVIGAFFSRCDYSLFETNAVCFCGFLKSAGEEFTQPSIVNYLTQTDRDHTLEEVNTLIYLVFGRPGESPFWHQFEGKLVRKIESWYNGKELTRLFRDRTGKLDVLSSYTDYIEELRADDNGLCRIRFPKFVLADEHKDDRYSYVILNPAYGMAIEPEELHGRQKIADAKEFFFGNDDALIYRLGFFEMHRMYTKDLLDILFGLAPKVSRSGGSFRKAKNNH